MQILSLAWGILAFLGTFVAFLPCLGSLNWLNIPFSGVGLLMSIITLATTDAPLKGKAIAGVVLCGLAIGIGSLRLMAGGGVL